MMEQDPNEHLDKLLAGQAGTRRFAELFEQSLTAAADPRRKVTLTRMLAEADQRIAEMDETIERERRSE
ncbi:MAG: hypothetical protein K8T89_14110 [Planctomycetes bacterium]|nr:hypothetical protein [Planctomycetota bacterium]